MRISRFLASYLFFDEDLQVLGLLPVLWWGSPGSWICPDSPPFRTLWSPRRESLQNKRRTCQTHPQRKSDQIFTLWNPRIKRNFRDRFFPLFHPAPARYKTWERQFRECISNKGLYQRVNLASFFSVITISCCNQERSCNRVLTSSAAQSVWKKTQMDSTTGLKNKNHSTRRSTSFIVHQFTQQLLRDLLLSGIPWDRPVLCK